MSPAVTAIVVVRTSAHGLERTVDALRLQERPADRLVIVDASGDAGIRTTARAAEPHLLIALPAGTPFGEGVDAALGELETLAPDALQGWLWLLEDGDVPEHDALEELGATVERNPSLVATGPKLLAADDDTVIAELGRTITRSGELVRLHRGELDQGQFDDRSDVLGLARNGMLVRAETWVDLDGFDPGLGDVDDALDFSVRAWLADGRVIVTPAARVRIPDRPDPSLREARTAQLHRQIAGAGPVGAVLHRIALVPAALLGALWHLVRKRPQRILPDLAAAFAVAFGTTRVGEARARVAATATQPPRVVERLQVSSDALRRDRAVARDEQRLASRDERERYALVGTGGAWVLLAAAIASAVLLLPLFGRGSLSGGALLPLSASIGDLWSHVGYGVRDPASGAFGVADPFVVLLALLGTVTFWQPSLSIVILWLAAAPLSALTAWMLTARLTRRPWLRAVGAFAWFLAPPLWTALADGRLPTVIVHILLPLLVFCGLRGARSWTVVAQTALVAAAVLACAPSLGPVLLALGVVAAVAAGRRWYRTLFLAVPSLALFAPLVVAQWNRGRPLGLLADPGVPVAVDPLRGADVALGLPDRDLGGWMHVLAGLGVGPGEGVGAALLLAACLLPLAMLVALGLVLRGRAIGWWSLAIALVAFAWAVVSGGIAIATSGSQPVALSIGPAQSLMFLGIVGAAVAGLAVTTRATLAWSALAVAGLAVLSAPAASAHLTGTAAVRDGASVALPAIVAAHASGDAAIGTLSIEPLPSGAMRVHLDRGLGMVLDEQSTLRATSGAFSEVDQRIAELAVTLASSASATPTSELHALGIGFVLVEKPEPDATPIAMRLTASLDGNPVFEPAGESGAGSLWRVVNPTVSPADVGVAGQLGTGNVDTELGRWMLIALAVILVGTIVLALPTGAAATRAERFGAAASRAGGPSGAVRAERPSRLSLDAPEPTGRRRFGSPAVEHERAPGYDPEPGEEQQ